MQCATYCSTKQLKKNSQEPQSSTVMPPKLGWGMAKLLQVTRPTAMYNCMSHPKKELGKQGVPKELRWQEGSHLLLQGAVLGCLPDGKAKGNLIDEICQVVNEVQDVVINCTHEVTKKVAQGIDGPASSDNQTHGAEGLLHVLVHGTLTSSFASLTCKDLIEDEEPAQHAHNEPRHSWHNLRLSCIACRKHDHCANQKSPEHALAKIWLHCREDQVELDHLQRDGD